MRWRNPGSHRSCHIWAASWLALTSSNAFRQPKARVADFGREPTVFGPAVGNLLRRVQRGVAEVEPGHPGGQNIDVLGRGRLVVAPRRGQQLAVANVDQLSENAVDGFNRPGLTVNQIPEGGEFATKRCELSVILPKTRWRTEEVGWLAERV